MGAARTVPSVPRRPNMCPVWDGWYLSGVGSLVEPYSASSGNYTEKTDFLLLSKTEKWHNPVACENSHQNGT